MTAKLKTAEPVQAKKTGKHLFKAGVSGNPNGRAKGVQNKYTMALKEMVETALELAGQRIQIPISGQLEAQGAEHISPAELLLLKVPPGVAYMVKQAEANPAQFLGLVKQLMPTKIDIDMTLQADDLIELVAQRRQSMAARKMQLIEGTAQESDE